MIPNSYLITIPVFVVLMVFSGNITAQEKLNMQMESIGSKDGTRIAFQKSGKGPPLVLVHGTTADHTRWAPVLPALEKHFTVYAIDRRGRGGSGDSDTYSIQRESEDIAAVIDSIGGLVDLLGHSFGGICALEASLLTPNIRKLVLYEPAPPGFKEAPDILSEMQTLLDSGDREGLLSTFFLEVAGLTAEEVELIRKAPFWQGRVAAAHTILRELKSIEDHPPFDPSKFKQVHTPTLLLSGGDSVPVYKETLQQLHSMLPNSRLVVMPGQQHVAMNTAPELFSGEVLNFLTKP